MFIMFMGNSEEWKDGRKDVEIEERREQGMEGHGRKTRIKQREDDGVEIEAERKREKHKRLER